ncbi:MAG: hypothetical protein H7222_09325 [Methylotenera sp.]|nr:hypothetical protein [Oligoflexia bacterium]
MSEFSWRYTKATHMPNHGISLDCRNFTDFMKKYTFTLKSSGAITTMAQVVETFYP